MKSKVRKISVCAAAAVIGVLILAVETQAAQSLTQVKSKWMGQNAVSLIEQHGYPDQVLETQAGNKVYVYVKKKRRLYSVPIYIPPTTHEIDTYEPDTGTYSYSYGVSNPQGTWAFEYRTRETQCTGYFEVDPSHAIVGVQFKGEDCPK